MRYRNVLRFRTLVKWRKSMHTKFERGQVNISGRFLRPLFKRLRRRIREHSRRIIEDTVGWCRTWSKGIL